MWKKVIVVVCLMTLSCLGLMVPRARAVSSPYQITYEHTDTTITYWALDASGNKIAASEQTWTIPPGDGSPHFVQPDSGGIQCSGGILAWVAAYYGPDGYWTFENHCVIYDPGYANAKWWLPPEQAAWQTVKDVFNQGQERVSWVANGGTTYFNVKDGVVTFLDEHKLYSDQGVQYVRVHYLLICTYDPALGKWQLEKRGYAFEDNHTKGMGKLIVGDGVVAWMVGGGITPDFDPFAFLKAVFNFGKDVFSIYCGDYLSIRQLEGDISTVLDESQGLLPAELAPGNWGTTFKAAKVQAPTTEPQVFYSVYEATPYQRGWKTGIYSGPYDPDIKFQPYTWDVDPSTGSGYFYISDASVCFPYTWTDEPADHHKTDYVGYINGSWQSGTTIPKANFFVTQPEGGQVPCEAGFWDMSIGTAASTRYWTFPDGTTSTVTSPMVTFQQANPGGVAQLCVNGSIAIRCVFTYDTPPNGAFVILGGSTINGVQYTNSANVKLVGWYSGVTTNIALGCSNGSDPVVWGPWTAVQPNGSTGVLTQSYQLPGGDGPKTVWVAYKNANTGDVTKYSASITLHTTPPAGRVCINSGEQVTAAEPVTLDLSASSDLPITQMVVYDDETYIVNPTFWLLGNSALWQPYQTDLSWSFWWTAYQISHNLRTGPRTVFVQFKDAAGNVSDPVSATITIDPNYLTDDFQVSINGGNGFWANSYYEAVTLHVYTNLTNITQVHLGNAQIDQTTGNILSVDWDSTWTAYPLPRLFTRVLNTKGFPPTSNNGVVAIFEDANGNQYGPVAASIKVDGIAPADGTLTATTSVTNAVLNWSGYSDAVSGIGSYELYYSPFGTPDRTTGTGTLIYKGLDNQFLQTGLTPNSVCYYRLYAVDNAGNISTGVTLQAKTLRKRRALPFLNLLLHD
jgi:hypothetical protein